MISVRGLWKVYGPKPERVIGSPDADLPRRELEAKTGNVIAMRDIDLDVAASLFGQQLERVLRQDPAVPQ